MDNIKALIDWNGGWASRFFFDDAINRHLNNKIQDYCLADYVAQQACGFSAQRTFVKYEQLTGYKVKADIKTDTINCKNIIPLDKIGNHITDKQSSHFWFEKLKFHLNTSNISTPIKKIWEEEIKPPKNNPVELLKKWSFPLLSELLPLKYNNENIIFVESDLASICWKRWHLSSANNPIWLETKNKSNISSSHFLVWRLIHEATHLLHLSNFPQAGEMSNPFWLLQMESVAMSAEYRFLSILESEEKIALPQNYYFNQKNIITILLLGLFERALRLEYEVSLYKEKISPDIWIKEIKYKYKFDLDIFDFAFEFHNMPGFMAGYMVGMEEYLTSNDELNLLNGSKLIFSNE